MSQKTSIAYEIVEKLWRLNRIFCSSDYDKSLEILQTYLPFKIHEYRTSKPFKGWTIPPKWDLVKATISFEGRVIYTVDHPLKIIGLSLPFKGQVNLDELKKHLHYDHRNSERIPYHFRQHYRPWERDWGFCVSKQFFDSLKEGAYQVEIVTEEQEGTLKVAEYIKQGKNPEGFAFVAHLDHPGMANDDLAGVAVGVELFKKLAVLDTKFTYRLVLVQEIIGSAFYLDKAPPVLESCFLEMLGSATPLALQYSRHQNSFLEKALEKSLQISTTPYRTGAFREIISNDEAVWESANIPMCSLSRYPYPEYHSDHDNLSIISESSLLEASNLLYQTVERLEKETLIKKCFTGVYSLAHPDYNLYVDPGQPAFGNLTSDTTRKLRALMDEIPLLPPYTFAGPLAERFALPPEQLLTTLRLWQQKGLLQLI